MIKKKDHGIIYTFYSYKGGVGRSMAVANVGALMTKLGYKVLIIDWDLEAPGLHHFFQKDFINIKGNAKVNLGIVDILHSRMRNEEIDWRKNLLEVQFAPNPLYILTAGKQDDGYQRRVQNINWDDLFDKYKISNYLDDLRNQLIHEFDFVLIDSRTGVTDIGDICTVLFPDIVVLFFVSNHQNIDGIDYIMKRASEAHKKLPVDRSKLLGVPIPSRDEVYTEYNQSRKWKDIYADKFRPYYEEWLPMNVKPRDALNKLFIPYFSNWSFGERLPVLENEDELDNPSTIGAAYFRLANLLVLELDWFEAIAISSAEEVKSAQAEVESVKYHAEKTTQEYQKTRKSLQYSQVTMSIIVIVSAIFLIRSYFFSSTENSELNIEVAREILNTHDSTKSNQEMVLALEYLVKQNEPLRGLELNNFIFYSAMLDSAFFSNSSFVNSEFLNTSLANSYLRRANLSYASFDNTDLSGTILNGALIFGADFRQASGITPDQILVTEGWQEAKFSPSFSDSLMMRYKLNYSDSLTLK